MDLSLRRNGLILCRNGFQVIINDDFLEEGGGGGGYGRLRYLTHSLWVNIHSMITASGSRLFGSLVEHWIIDPAVRVRFPLKSWDFFSSNLFALFFVTAFMS